MKAEAGKEFRDGGTEKKGEPAEMMEETQGGQRETQRQRLKA